MSIVRKTSKKIKSVLNKRYKVLKKYSRRNNKIKADQIGGCQENYRKLMTKSCKINATTKLQQLIRNELLLSPENKELKWLNTQLLPGVIDNLRTGNGINIDDISLDSTFDNCSDYSRDPIDVIIPVYKGYKETLDCIQSVLGCKTNKKYQLIIINDKSPEVELSSVLKDLSVEKGFTLIENPQNLGFVSTVNLGMKLHQERNVILLNSDTVVTDYWLDRISDAAYSEMNIGTVTPFSNNATICSYPRFCVDNKYPEDIPLSELNNYFHKVNGNKVVDLPTAHGFCMFIKRNVLNEIGYFDSQKWGKGYAEENDFSLKAARRGWRNVLAANVFVKHLGAVSFAESADAFIAINLKKLNLIYPDYSKNVQEFIKLDPIRPLRNNISLAYLKKMAGAEKIKGTMLFVSHTLGGGTTVATDELAEQLHKEGQLVYMLTAPKSGVWELSCYKNNMHIEYRWPEEQQLLINDLKALGVWHIHYHHTIQFPLQIWALPQKLDVDYDVTLHDYFTICPRVTLIDETKKYCGEVGIDACTKCLRKNGPHTASRINLNDTKGSIKGWRDLHFDALSRARTVFTPSHDTKARMENYFELKNIVVKPHIEQYSNIQPIDFSHAEMINVVFIGAIDNHKGLDVLIRCAKYANRNKLPLRFIVIGYTSKDELLQELPNVTVTGRYQRDELQSLIKYYNCHVAALLSVWPETYSYTFSEALRAGLSVLTFEIGAMVERSEHVETVAFNNINDSPDKICNQIFSLANKSKDYSTFKFGCKYKNILIDYYHLESATKVVNDSAYNEILL